MDGAGGGGLGELRHSFHEVLLRLVDLALQNVSLHDCGRVQLDMRLPLKYDRLIDCVLNQHIVKIAFHSRRHLEYDRLRRLTPVRQVDQGLHHLLDAFILEACRPLAYEVREGPEYVFSISGRRRTILNLAALGLEDHEEDVLLDLVAGFEQGIDAIVDYERSEENEHGHGDLDRDHLVLCIVPVEAHRSEYAHEELPQHPVFDVGDANPLEKCRADLQADGLHPDVGLHQMLDYLVELVSEAGHVLRVLADHCDNKLTHGWHQVLHVLIPIVLICQEGLYQS